MPQSVVGSLNLCLSVSGVLCWLMWGWVVDVVAEMLQHMAPQASSFMVGQHLSGRGEKCLIVAGERNGRTMNISHLSVTKTWKSSPPSRNAPWETKIIISWANDSPDGIKSAWVNSSVNCEWLNKSAVDYTLLYHYCSLKFSPHLQFSGFFALTALSSVIFTDFCSLTSTIVSSDYTDLSEL